MLITNGRILTPDQILDDHALYLEGGEIKAIGRTVDLRERFPYQTPIDARGQLIMPGNICAHTHFYGAFARGMSIPGDPPKDFPEILTRLWWNLDKALDRDAVRLSALVCLVDAIKHGTTTLFDHHASPNFITGSLDVIADAVEQAGLRAVLCYEVTDRDGREKAEEGIAENVRFLMAQREMVKGTFGLHASLSLSDETLRLCRDSNPTKGFHIHVAEHEADEIDSLKKYSKRVAHRLNNLGMLNAWTIAAHCIHIDDSERAVLRDNDVWITHQPRSNMNNGVGAMAWDTMINEGMKVCIGNDGFSNAMWEDWKAAYLLHKVAHRDPRQANGAAIWQAATGNNAALTQVFFPQAPIGQLIEGARADMIFVDYHPFTPLTVGNLPWHILFGFESSMVTTTIVEGRVLMRDRQLITLDERAIAEEARALAPDVWERYAAYARR